MQFQSDVLQKNISRPLNYETTALGAALLAGLNTGFWLMTDLKAMKQQNTVFKPEQDVAVSNKKYKKWQKAVNLTKGWLND